jgi:hypothetical protein
MKILKYGGIASLSLLVVFFAMGFVIPAFEYETSVSISASPEQCWAVLQDTSRMKNWMPGFRKLTLKSGVDNHTGAVYELIVTQDETYVMTETLKASREPEELSYDLNNDVMTLEYRFALTRAGSQTHIAGHYKVRGNNPVWKSLLFLSKAYLKRSSQEQLDLLKTEVEK